MSKDYTLPEKTETLTLDDGLEVVVRLSPIPFADYLEVVELLESNRNASGFRRIAEVFAAHGLIRWNIKVPATADGFASIDFNLALGIVSAWVRAVGAVPVPLLSASSST